MYCTYALIVQEDQKTTGVEQTDECMELALIKRLNNSVFIGFAVISRQVIFYVLDFGIGFVNKQLNHLIWK